MRVPRSLPNAGATLLTGAVLLLGPALLHESSVLLVAADVLPEPAMPSLEAPARPSIASLTDPGAWVEKTGIVRRERSKRRFRKWMGDTLLLLSVTDREEYTLLRGRNKLVVQALEAQVGQLVSVTGPVIPGNDRHPRPGLKVMHAAPVSNPGGLPPASDSRKALPGGKEE